MGFDDLARHMASRDGNALAAPSDANEFVRRANEDNRRIDRRNNLILGPILLLGGLAGVIVLGALALDGSAVTTGWVRSVALMTLAGGAACVGAVRVWRGLRG
ncbi:MAG: hypothetical protein ACKV2T_09375 [Kofleriaceae bacterium]